METSGWELSLVSRKAIVKREKREDGSRGLCYHGASFFLEERIPCLRWRLCGRVGGSRLGQASASFLGVLGSRAGHAYEDEVLEPWRWRKI